MPAEDKKTGVLFVCLGNICRSPAAEAVFQSLVTKANLGGEFRIDSCGTGGGIRNWCTPGPVEEDLIWALVMMMAHSQGCMLWQVQRCAILPRGWPSR